jgi:hypothetical protein
MCSYLGKFVHLGAMQLSLLFVTTSATLAGVVIQETPISFGTIDLHPGGDTIVIAAEFDPVPSPSGTRSVVTGAHSGLITLATSSTEEEHVDISCPDSIVLSQAGGGHLTLRNIHKHSQCNDSGIVLGQGAPPVRIRLGGELVLRGREASGNYSGSLSISLNFY